MRYEIYMRIIYIYIYKNYIYNIYKNYIHGKELCI